MKRIISLLFLLLFLIPIVYAEEEEKCGLLNLASCLPQKMYDFFINLMNAPIQPLQSLMA